MPVERTRRSSSNPPPDEAAAHVEKTEKDLANIRNAKLLSFRTMAACLLDDVTSRHFGTETRLLVQPGDKKSPAPLAKTVAEEQLSLLGLASHVVLHLGNANEVIGLNPDFKETLTPEEVEDRRAVIGYEWNEAVDELDSSARAHFGRKLRLLDERAKISQDALIRDNLDVIPKGVGKYRNRNIPDDELESEALLSLSRVAPKFDWRKGYPFAPYAVRSIRGSVIRSFRDGIFATSKPRKVWENDPPVMAARAELEGNGIVPTSEALAAKTGLTVEAVEDVLFYRTLWVDSLSQQVQGGEGALELGATLSEHSSEERIILSLMIDAIVARLSERDREIFIRRVLGQTQSDIGKAVGLSQMHVSRLLNGIQEMIRKELSVEEDGEKDSRSQLGRIDPVAFAAVLQYPNLSERDQSIARMFREGMSAEAIGERLRMSEKSILKIEEYLLHIHKANSRTKKSATVSIRTYDL